MGVVYKARQPGLDRVVALKMILAGAHAGAEQRLRFRGEAEAVARLQHPNIVQVYEVGEHDGCPYFALEFVDGGSLEKPLPRACRRRCEAAALVEPLARAVHDAHQPRRRPPRPEAGQRPADGRRHAQDHRLRPGQAPRRRAGRHAHRRRPGHAQLHGPRAGRRQDQGGRPGRRRLRPGRDPLRVADRPAAVPGPKRLGDGPPGAHRRARAALARATRACRATWRRSA